MRRTRDRIAHAYRRTKVLGQQAWKRSERVLGVLDKGAHLATQGLKVLGDRLDPEVRVGASRVLNQYKSTRFKMKNVQDNLQRAGRAVKDAGFEY